VPDSLPCLLSCIEWNNRNEVYEMYRLLEHWPRPLPVQKALELLDYKNADCYIRSFAVDSIRNIEDEDLMLYLLQLLQAIKHESYVKNDLVSFLIERAVKNQRIGHFLFWHLRSELHSPFSETRFGLILEAYLKSSTHLASMARQFTCVDQFKIINTLLHDSAFAKEKGDFSKTKI
jgi:phosphatidylinositol-4,5-bisphosphate 3-kinase catalytic subunit alpha/beta/delta